MLSYFEEKSSLINGTYTGDLCFYKKFLWEVKKSVGSLEKKNGEDESAKRSKY